MSSNAVLQVSVDGAPVVTGHVVASLNSVVQLTRAAADSVRTVRYELHAYPPGYNCPSGWTNNSGIYTYTGELPPTFTLTLWGKYLPRLRFNGVSDLDLTGQLDKTVGIEVYGENGLRDTALGELSQCGGVAQSIQENWRILEGGGSGVGWPSIVRVTGAAYSPTEAVVLAGLTVKAGRNDVQNINLPDITTTPTKAVTVTIYGYDGNISPTNVVTVMGTSVDADTAFIDAQGESLIYMWMGEGWVLL